MITVGNRLDDCTVEDLGSTNKSHVVDESGEPQAMTPGTVYPLASQAQLVFGDVQGTFEFLGAKHHTAGNSSTDSRRRVDIETIKTPGTSTWASGRHARTAGTETTSKSLRTTVMSTTGKRKYHAQKSAPDQIVCQ